MCLIGLLVLVDVAGSEPASCEPVISADLTIDQGHRWRPPFGLERVGSPLLAHIEIDSAQALLATYYLTFYRGNRQLKRQKLDLSINPSDYGGYSSFLSKADIGKRFAHLPLSPQITEAVLERECGGRSEVLDRRAVARPALEVDAIAHPQRRANPVDLGAILPPYDGLLMKDAESADVELVALSTARDLPSVRFVAWFSGGRRFEKRLALIKGQRTSGLITLPLSSVAEKTELHIRLLDGDEKSLFSKDINVMVARRPSQHWPAFGAVETKLRYDAAIPSFDPLSGAAIRPIPYDSAWDERFKDVVVFLPNGSRFVFWRGANYVPFWAGRNNTGALYQWVENCNKEMRVDHPDGSWDCPEPIFDSELRYGRVRILESSTARVHVRWDYQLTDIHYKVRGGSAVEDFYFYPDGFGTRVVTFVASPDADPPQLSEILVITPPSAYPLQVLPEYPIEVIGLDSDHKDRISFPYAQSQQSDPESSKTRFSLLPLSGNAPALFRIFSHKDDRTSAIYLQFNGRADVSVLAPYAFPPMYDRGEIVSPAYWGNHWPLTRGKWTGWTINDQISAGPSHSSMAVWIPIDPDSKKLRFEMAPLQKSQWEMPGCTARNRLCVLNKFIWMIGNTELADRDVSEMAKSYLHPPNLTVTGARLAIPAYSPERRALRVVAESPSIDIELQAQRAIVNPVFEIEGAPKDVTSITLNGEILAAEYYQWDGSVLWVGAKIPAGGGKIVARFPGEIAIPLSRADAR